MSNDLLDELLNRSARPTGGAEEVSPGLYLAMAREARTAARAPRRAVRVGVGVGLTALLVGGSGAAMASGIFQWSGWAADPDITYAFSLPSGRQCEERILINEAPSAGDGIPTPSPQGAALRKWAQAANFDALLNVPAELSALDPVDGLTRAEKEAGTISPDPNGPSAVMIVLRDRGGLDVVPKTTAGPTTDDLYANAVDTGLSKLINAKAAAIVADSGVTDGWSTNLEMQCEPAA